MQSILSSNAKPVLAGLFCGAIAVFLVLHYVRPGSPTSSAPTESAPTPPQDPAAAQAAKTDQQALQGQWRIVPPFQALGGSFDTPVFGLNFAKDKLTFSLHPSFEHDCRVELEATANPKRITLHGPIPGQIKKGLYELSDDGKTLTIALGRGDLCPDRLTPHQREMPYGGSVSFWFLKCVREQPQAKGNPDVPYRALWFNWMASFHPPGKELLLQFEEQGRKQQHDAALASLNELIKLWPDDGELLLLRGQLQLQARKDYQAARKDFETALTVMDTAKVNVRLAWLLASCPDQALRNGPRAVQMAERACKLTAEKDPDCLSARAAAAAEQGKFTEAIEWENKAIDLPDGYNDADKAAAQKRLQLYEQGKPYRME